MSKFLEAVRKLFSKKNAGKDSKADDDSSNASSQNEFQKAHRAPRQYDEVTMEKDGTGPKVGDDEHSTNNCQTPPKRAQRTYDEVEIAAPGGGAVEVK